MTRRRPCADSSRVVVQDVDAVDRRGLARPVLRRGWTRRAVDRLAPCRAARAGGGASGARQPLGPHGADLLDRGLGLRVALEPVVDGLDRATQRRQVGVAGRDERARRGGRGSPHPPLVRLLPARASAGSAARAASRRAVRWRPSSPSNASRFDEHDDRARPQVHVGGQVLGDRVVARCRRSTRPAARRRRSASIAPADGISAPRAPSARSVRSATRERWNASVLPA